MDVLAVGLTEFGGPEVLAVREVPLVEPVGDEVRVHVHAACVNPVDTLCRVGVTTPLRQDGIPLVPGMDFAGTVEAVGDSADWQLGDAVVGVTRHDQEPMHGGYSSRIVVPGASLVRAPHAEDGTTNFVAASTYLMNGLAALHGLDQLDLSPGATLGVTGAAGAVGGFVVQMAKKAGLRVVADAAEADVDRVASKGADVIVPRGEGVGARFTDAAGGQLDAVYDAALIGPDTFPAIRDGGAIAIIRPQEWQPGRGITKFRAKCTELFLLPDRLERVRALVEDGTLDLEVHATYAPSRAADAHRVLEAGGVRGRQVIDWSLD